MPSWVIKTKPLTQDIPKEEEEEEEVIPIRREVTMDPDIITQRFRMKLTKNIEFTNETIEESDTESDSDSEMNMEQLGKISMKSFGQSSVHFTPTELTPKCILK